MGVCALILLSCRRRRGPVRCAARRRAHPPPEHDEEGPAVLRFLEKHALAPQRPPLREGGEAPAPPPHRDPRAREAQGGGGARGARAQGEGATGSPRSRAATPTQAICHVFGSYCNEALAVARCESGLQTDAQNGQYLGLFQMGSSERRIFGHGSSARRAGDRRRTATSCLGSRLEPLVLQALELTLVARFRPQSAGPGPPAGFPSGAIAGRCLTVACSGGSLTA